MKIGIIGKGGAGKSTLIALLAREHAFNAYEADPLGGLRALHPGAEEYAGISAEPCMIEFPLLEQGIKKLAKEAEIKIVLMTTPHLHALEEARGVIETIRRYCPNETLGLVVTQSGRNTAERVAEKLNLKLLGYMPQEHRLDNQLIEGDLRKYQTSKRLEKALNTIAAKLGLKKRDVEKKRNLHLFGRK